MNLVIMTGRLGKDVEVRNMFTKSGKQMTLANFSIANTVYANGGTKTNWITCCAFGKMAETLAKNTKKGENIFIRGSWDSNSYEKDGKKNYANTLIVESWEKAYNKPEKEEPTGDTKYMPPTENDFMPPFN